MFKEHASVFGDRTFRNTYVQFDKNWILITQRLGINACLKKQNECKLKCQDYTKWVCIMWFLTATLKYFPFILIRS